MPSNKLKYNNIITQGALQTLKKCYIHLSDENLTLIYTSNTLSNLTHPSSKQLQSGSEHGVGPDVCDFVH